MEFRSSDQKGRARARLQKPTANTGNEGETTDKRQKNGTQTGVKQAALPEARANYKGIRENPEFRRADRLNASDGTQEASCGALS
ncbi:hypothetical protein [Burkholderia sp. Ax-1719]|jgi:hypothetical protein|uniref:hypothetical protein n=1 Tax=Burkholderia sp. Ax-1719 TaxID=2608334 RepID=UPI00141ED210|nr:hypothetical protein [Burkholderia sp. Ax-1719]NIE67166.1 hypothetical protein [Burkholderia sp. Ax-1719]